MLDNCRGWMHRIKAQTDELESVNGCGEDSHNNQPFDYLDRKKMTMPLGKQWDCCQCHVMQHDVGEMGCSEEFDTIHLSRGLPEGCSNALYV